MSSELNSEFDVGSFEWSLQEEDEQVDIHIGSIIRIHDSLMSSLVLTPESRLLDAHALSTRATTLRSL
jgi:hypothetical protein